MVEAEDAIEVAEESRMGVFEDITERTVERAQAGRRAPAGPQTEALGVGVPLDRSRAGEALQGDVRIAQLDVDFVLGTGALVVEQQRAAETVGVQSAVASPRHTDRRRRSGSGRCIGCCRVYPLSRFLLRKVLQKLPRSRRPSDASLHTLP